MRDFLAITKALADETRVRLLVALRDQELCLCQLVEERLSHYRRVRDEIRAFVESLPASLVPSGAKPQP